MDGTSELCTKILLELVKRTDIIDEYYSLNIDNDEHIYFKGNIYYAIYAIENYILKKTNHSIILETLDRIKIKDKMNTDELIGAIIIYIFEVDHYLVKCLEPKII